MGDRLGEYVERVDPDFRRQRAGVFITFLWLYAASVFLLCGRSYSSTRAPGTVLVYYFMRNNSYKRGHTAVVGRYIAGLRYKLLPQALF